MTKEAILDFSRAHAEPDWLRERRLKAYDVIEELALPRLSVSSFIAGTLETVPSQTAHSQLTFLTLQHLGTIQSWCK